MTPKDRLDDLRRLADRYNVDRIAATVIDNPAFALWTGGGENCHHYGTGGLLRHTWEVVTLCEANAAFARQQGKQVEGRVLFCAALFHDVAKIGDYEPVGSMPEPLTLQRMSEGFPISGWIKTPAKRLIHHVSGSAIAWAKAVATTGECRDIEEAVLHCILSHHGEPNWGSPVGPKTREAWILHLSDQLSARVDDCDRVDLHA